MRLLEDYTAAGFDPAAFWELSPRLFVAQMRGAVRRNENRRNAGIADAWLTAALSRAKRMPKLERLLVRRLQPQRAQSREIMQAMCDALAAAWGAKG